MNEALVRSVGRKLWWVLAAALAIAMCGPALGHGPVPQRVIETVEVDAAPDVVWQRLGNFADAGWHPLVVATKAGHGNQTGAVRTIDLRDGGRIVESLKSRSDNDRTLTFELVESGPLPVSLYTASLTVKPGTTGKTSVVEWTALFMRADRSPRPEAGKTDAAAVAAVTEYLSVGLSAVRTSATNP